MPAYESFAHYNHTSYIFTDYINSTKGSIEMLKVSPKDHPLRITTSVVFVPPARDYELQHHVMNENIEQAEKPVFVKDRSIFAPWIEDNSRSINKCFEYDKQRWKLSRFMKSEIEIKTVESFLKQNYGLLKDLFDTA